MKLGPDNRETLLAALAPPPGYRVEAALATSYTVDLAALTAAMLSLTGYEWPDSGEAKVPTAEFIGARYALRDRFRVLFDQGRLTTKSLRPEGLERMNSLDRFLVPRQQPSAFHPKVWVVKYVSTLKGAVARYRLLCASRNLTLSPCWELAAMLEGCATSKLQRIGNAVGELLVATAAGTKLPPAVKQLCAELKTVEFRLPGASPEQVEFLGQWPSGTSLWKDVPTTFARAVVVAPFVEGPFLRRLRDRCKGRITVLSTLDALAPLKDTVQQLDIDAYVIREVLSGQDFSLHAKLLLLEAGGRQIAYLGSANATSAAWGMQGRNTEAVLRLTDVIRIDPFLRSFADPKNEAIRWLQNLEEIDGDLIATDEELKNAVRAVRQQARIEATYDATTKILAVKAVHLPFPVRVRPSTVAEESARSLTEGQTVEFDLSRSALTRFLVLTISQGGKSDELVFVVDVRGMSDELLDRRDGAFDAKDPGSLEQALLHLFMMETGGGRTEEDGPPRPPDDPPGSRTAAGAAIPLSQVTLERVLRACSSRPDTADIALRMMGGLAPDRASVLTALVRRVQEAQRARVA